MVEQVLVSLTFQLVVFDLMGTLLWGRKGHRVSLINIYRKVGGLKGVSKRKIEQAIAQVRKRASPEHIRPGMYWPFVNAMILQELDPDKFIPMKLPELIELGEEIHQLYQSEHRRYQVNPQIRGMLTRLSNAGVPMCLGSNQEVALADELLEKFGLERYFPKDLRFTSELLGVHKPQREFLLRIASHLGVQVERVLHVGNSMNSDVPLVRTGCCVVLFDHGGRHSTSLDSRRVLEEYREYTDKHRLLVERSPQRIANFLLKSMDPSVLLSTS